MQPSELSEKIDRELQRAHQARSQGNEGQARVCARRAAGIAIRAYLEKQGLHSSGPSAIDALAFIKSMPGLSVELHQAIDHLLARVDECFSLPEEFDLLADARWLVDWLQQHPEGGDI